MNTTITKTTKPANRPEGFSKADWENKTYRVYMGILKLDKREITLATFANHPIVVELMGKLCNCKVQADYQKMSLLLFEDMCKFCTRDHQKVNHVKTIASLRNFFKGEWKELAKRPVVNKEPKKPTPVKGEKGTKGKNNKVTSINDVPEDVKKSIIAEYYKKNRNNKKKSA